MRKAATTGERGAAFHQKNSPLGGAELSDDSPGNRPVSKAGGTPCGTVGDVDLELVAVIQAWASLSKEIQQQIMLLVG